MRFFGDQVSSSSFFGDLFYTVGAVSVILVVLALGLVDTALARRKNVLDTWLQKLLAALIAGLGTLLGGYGLWQWQFNSALGVHNPLGQALSDWWIGGRFQTTFAQNIDPRILPGADVQQIFLIFFVTFSMATVALIHTGAMERMKPLPLYTMAFVIGLVLSPLVGYFCWGSVGPLTVHGTHDFDGVFPLYIFAGAWVAVLNLRLGPRLGAFESSPTAAGMGAQNQGIATAGVLLILFALPFIALGSGYVIPGRGFFGISYTTSGWGIVLTNIFAAYVGGALSGALIAYVRREPMWALLGPVAGAVITGTLFDIGLPWQVLVVSLFGPPVALGTARLLRRVRIDDPKVIPLALGPGAVGAIATGFIKWHTKTGGLPGATGKYALGHAAITPWWQLLGVLLTIGLAAIPCLLLCVIFERSSGLRVTEEQEIAGLDETYWDTSNFGDERLPELERDGSAIPAAGTAALRTNAVTNATH
jgi:Amt family ammonium transporter